MYFIRSAALSDTAAAGGLVGPITVPAKAKRRPETSIVSHSWGYNYMRYMASQPPLLPASRRQIKHDVEVGLHADGVSRIRCVSTPSQILRRGANVVHMGSQSNALCHLRKTPQAHVLAPWVVHVVLEGWQCRIVSLRFGEGVIDS